MRNSKSFKDFRRNGRLAACLAILVVAALSLAATPGQAQAPACDINGDGGVNLSDIALFATLYGAGAYDRRIDLNGDGVINLVDLSLFVGCF